MDGNISALVSAKRYAEAIERLEELIARDPTRSDTWYSLGFCHFESQHFAQAAAAFDRVLALEPGNAHAQLGLGIAAQQSGNPGRARAVLSAVLAREPGNAQAWNVYGLACKALGQHDDAIEAFGRALQLQPELDLAWSNQGNAQVALGRHADARISYERALRIRPGNALTRWNLALAQLYLGDWHEGWRNYEARWLTRAPIFSPRPFFNQPWWRGESLAGRHLFLHAEQGRGDALQFCRYAPWLAVQAGRVTLEVDRSLLGLMQASMPSSVAVMARGDPVPGFDFHCPLMSVPLALGDRLTVLSETLPYIRSDGKLAAAWRQRLPAGPAQWWGIAWSSGISNARRDVPLQQLLAVLLAHPAIASGAIGLLGLQTDLSEGDRPALAACQRLQWLGPQLRDFSDTAAVLENCSRIISVDTALAHLAGAMGRPLHLLLPASADWRWAALQGPQAWYAGIHACRQQREGDWQEPLAQLAAAL